MFRTTSVLFLVMLFVSGCGKSENKEAVSDKSGSATARGYLRNKIIARAEAGEKVVFFLDYMGKVQKATLAETTGEELGAYVDGLLVEMPWSGLTDARFLELAAACINQDSAADHLQLAKFATECGFAGRAEKELAKVLELDPDLAGEVAQLQKTSAGKSISGTPPPQPEEIPTAANAAPVEIPASDEKPAVEERLLAEKVGGWLPTGLSGGGGMFAPVISGADPDLMMINCDMSGCYVTEDGGKWWRMVDYKQRRSYLPCPPAFHPKDANVILAPNWGHLKLSRDKGRTWEDWGDIGESARGDLRYDPDYPDLVLVGTQNGCRISRDAGRNWKKCDGPTGTAIAAHFDRTSSADKRVMFIGTSAGIWRSDDAGETWTRKTKGLPGSGREVNGFSGGSNPGTGRIMLYCTVPSKAVAGKFKGGVYSSSDRGDSWQSAMGEGINKDTKQFDKWSAGSIPTYKWVFTTDTAPQTVCAMNSSTGFWPPHDETVWRSDDGGKTWRETLFIDPRFPQYNVAPNYVTASMGQSYKGGEPPFGANICPTDPNRLILVWGKCFITHDGGKSWFNGHTFPPAGVKPEPGSPWISNGLVVTTTWHYYVDPFEHNRHYIAYTDLAFARSTDSGKTWRWWEKGREAPWKNTCYELAFDPEVPGRVWGAFTVVHDIPNGNIIHNRHWSGNPESGGGGVCLSTDFCRSWKSETKGLPDSPVTSLVLDPKSPKGKRTLYAAVFGKGVYKSIDDGKTWVKKNRGLGHPSNMRLYRLILHSDGTLFALITAHKVGKTFKPEGVGLYRSDNGGDSWKHIATDPVLLWPKDFGVDPRNSKVIFIGAADANESRGGLYRTVDGGKIWKQVARFGRQHFGAYFHPKRPGWVYATMCEGAPEHASLWLSTDNGDSWKPFKTFPFENTQRVQFDPDDPDLIYVTTFGGSIFKGPAEPLEVRKQQPEEAVPGKD